ncbi:MAG TPA: Nif3-like dinuclear metal center hexameric protein [Bacillota bacterium]|nr:Nif3-like dinuclear metal center hexameric protein [Bacillota bacterium]
MIDLEKLLSIIDELAPAAGADADDQPSILREGETVEFGRIGVCVDPTERNLYAAAARDIRFIITYHPWRGEAYETVEAKDMTIMQIHSAADRGEEGNNYILGQLLGLSGIKPVADGIVGNADLLLKELIERGQRVLELNVVPYWGDLNSRVNKVALFVGPGFLPLYRSAWECWLDEGCDTILTGELGRFPVCLAAMRHLKLVDFGHGSMAKSGMSHLAYRLRNRLKALECEVEFLDDLYGMNYYTTWFFPHLEDEPGVGRL